MSKVTSKYQVSIPKALADRLRIAPGDEVEWSVAGQQLRVTPRAPQRSLSVDERLALFDAATKRQQTRNKRRKGRVSRRGRGWTREELYDRGRAR